MSRLTIAAALAGALLFAESTAHAQFIGARPERREALAAGWVPVDEVAAAVEIQGERQAPIFVLASELDMALRIELAARRLTSPDPTALASIRRATLEQFVGERLLERDAVRSGDPPPPEDALQTARESLLAQLAASGGPERVFRGLDIRPEDLDALVRRRVVALRYLRAHLESSVMPTDAEIREAYNSERIEPFRARGMSLAMARPEIVDALVEAAYPRAIIAYLRSIGSHSLIRVWDSSLAPATPSDDLAP